MDEEQSANEAQASVSEAKDKAVEGAKKAKEGAQKAKEGAKKVAEASKKVASGIAKAGKAIYSIISAIISFIGAFWWLILIILLIVLIVAIIIIVIGMAITVGINGVYENGMYTPSGGAIGDKFYGERYLYNDFAYSNSEISESYEEFSWGVIKGAIQKNVITITSFPESYSQSEDAIKVSLDFAKSISSLHDDGMAINYYAGGIDHYGLTTSESENFLNLMADYLNDKHYNKNGSTKNDIYNALKDSFDEEYSYMKNVCSRVIIKDFLFEEDSGIINIDSKNYLGMVFMPKEDITITSTEFAFIVPQGITVEASYNHVDESNTTELASDTADSTWFVDGIVEKSLEVNTSEYPIAKFSAIDEENMEYLAQGVSIFKLLKDDKFGVYFNDIEISVETTIETLLNNVKTESYQYLMCDSSGYYIVADILTEY